MEARVRDRGFDRRSRGFGVVWQKFSHMHETLLHWLCARLEKMSVADVWKENPGRWQKKKIKKNPIRPRCRKPNRVTSQALPFLQSALQGGPAAGMYFTLTHTDSIWSSGPLNHLQEEMFNSLTLCLCVTHVNASACARLPLPPDYYDVALQEWKWTILLCT